MDPIEYIAALRKRWITIVVLALVGAIAAYSYALTLTPTYKATSSVFVSSPSGDSNSSSLLQGQTYTQNLVSSYAQLATMPAVLKPVISDLGLNTSATDLSRQVTANNPLNTVIIQISVTDSSAQQSAAIANAIAASLGKVAGNLSRDGGTGPASIHMSITSPAQVPLSPVAPSKALIGATGLIAGLVVGIIYALLRQLLDTRIRGVADVKRLGDVPVLGQIQRRRRGEVAGIAMASSPHSHVAEGFRRLRANLEFAEVDAGISSVIVTSALPGEGKSTVALNLALAVAESRKRVLVIDGDLRRPSIADYTHVEGVTGLTTVLAGHEKLAHAVQRLTDRVDVLASGMIPPNPGQLLSSDAMRDLVSHARAEYDFVVIDSPPLLPAADALALAHLTDGAIVVALHNSTHRAQLRRTLDDLLGVNARVLGVLLNQTKHDRRRTYYSYGSAPSRAASAASDERLGMNGPKIEQEIDRLHDNGDRLERIRLQSSESTATEAIDYTRAEQRAASART